jgi:hypothetical protein
MNQNSEPANSPVTLINVFEVPAEHVDVFVAQWRERAGSRSTTRTSISRSRAGWATSYPNRDRDGRRRRACRGRPIR